MCGICGFTNLEDSNDLQRDILFDMMRVMEHRGPDDQGYFLDEKIALGSCRLSIIDLESGKQPISNEDQTLWIVFNGEIYNYRELRIYLHKRGHKFKTQSDTEVILHLYEEFGVNCVHHLDGIFAFAIWDSVNEEVFIARDRLGIKPLYYTISAGQFIFGSEFKVILSHPAVHRDIDLISLDEYLSYEYVPTPRTIIRNIFRLEPGHYLRFSDNVLDIHQYWDISFKRSESRPPVNWSDYASGLNETLRNCVRKELVSDVPVGVLLSGGIDSSTIAAFMVEEYPGKVESFTIGFEDDSFDESNYARLVSKHLGTNHNEMILSSDMALNMVRSITDYLDEPFADSSFIPTLFLSKFAQKKVKVVLGGDGGDELLAGYPTMKAHRLIGYYERIVPWTVRAHISPRFVNLMSVSFDNISLDFRLRRFLGGRGVPLIARNHRWLGSFVEEEKAQLLNDWIKPVLRDTYHTAYELVNECDAQLPLNQVLYDDMKMYLEGDILYKVDRASMASSLEVRVPFLNREAVKYITELPMELKLHRLNGKYILKKGMRNKLPKEILSRSKKGFNMPVAYWLSGELNELLMDMLSTDYIKQQGYFNHSYVNELIKDHLSRRKDNRKLLWTLLIFQMWYSKFIKS
jgi:asparagine synthase (glutamine-hydrolysing)